MIPGFSGAAQKPPKRPKSKPKPIKRNSQPNRVRQTKAGKESESLDRLFSRYIRLRDPLCKVCSAARSTDCAHLLGVGSYPRIKWNKNNAVGACRACHTFYTAEPVGWRVWILNFSGVDFFKLLRSLEDPKPDRAAIRQDLLREIKQLEGRA